MMALALVLTFFMALQQVPMSAYAADSVVSVTNGAELDAAIKAATTGTTIVLANDIDAVSSATYSTSASFVIDGAGHTINGNAVAKTALRFSNSSANITLSNLTMRNMRSQLSYGGGAIGVYKGKLTINNCAFIGNEHNSGSTSTSTSNGGGAVCVHSSSGSLAINNATFYGNTSNAGGGAILSKCKATVTGCTVVGNTAGTYGGGVCASGSNLITLSNSIVADNKNAAGVPTDTRYLVDGGYNLLGVVADTSTAATTLTGETAESLGLESGMPQDNGLAQEAAGSPWTIAIVDSASPAIDAAASTASARDQRGFARVSEPDIGAYEYTDTSAVKAPQASPRGGTYFEAQTVALSAVEGASIYYTLDGTTPARDTGTGTLYDAPFTLSETTTLKAIAYLGDRSSTILSAAYSIRLPQEVHVTTGQELDAALRAASDTQLTVITLDNDIDAISSATYGNGVRVRIEGDGHAIRGNSQNNTALRFKKDNDSIVLRNLVMDGMKSSLKYGGGAIGVYKGDITIENCTFINNTCSAEEAGGGAVLAHSSSSYLTVINSTFYGNSSTGKEGEGGAIQAKGRGDIINCTIVGNSAVSKGGGIRNESTSISGQTWVYNTIIVGNTAKSGADVYRATDRGGNIFGTTYGVLEPNSALTLENYSVASAGLVAGAPQDNGGLTPTIALADTSVAIGFAAYGGTASPLTPAYDQRGYLRDGAPDAGAFEAAAAPQLDLRGTLAALVAKAEAEYAPRLDRFTTEIQQLFTQRLAAARSLVSGDTADDAALQAAFEQLQEICDLIDAADPNTRHLNNEEVALLEIILAGFSQSVEAHYTAGSWAAFAAAHSAVQNIIDNSQQYTAPQAQAASVTLSNAYAALVSVKLLDETLAIATAQLAGGNYIPASVAYVQGCLDAALIVRAQANATQAEIDAANAALLEALGYLFEKGDTEALGRLIDSIALLQETAYTPQSWQILSDALSAARVVAADENALQESVSAAAQDLTDAVADLTLRAQNAALVSLIAQAQAALSAPERYVAGSIAGLAGVTASAQAVVADPNATQAQVDAAALELNQALTSLRLRADSSALQELFNRLNALSLSSQTLYTAASIAQLQSALYNAAAVLALSPDVVAQGQIDAAVAALAHAEAHLVLAQAGGGDTGNAGAAGNLAGASGTPGTGAYAAEALAPAAGGTIGGTTTPAPATPATAADAAQSQGARGVQSAQGAQGGTAQSTETLSESPVALAAAAAGAPAAQGFAIEGTVSLALALGALVFFLAGLVLFIRARRMHARSS